MQKPDYTAHPPACASRPYSPTLVCPRPCGQVSDMRISYERGALSEEQMQGADPMQVWDTWFKRAVDMKVSVWTKK